MFTNFTKLFVKKKGPNRTANSQPARKETSRRLSMEVLEDRMLLSGDSWWVDGNVTSSGNGTSLGTPFKTIQEAANVAQAGSTVNIRGGTYRETVIPINSGTSSNPITFQAYNNETVTVSGTELVTAWTQQSGNIYQASMLDSMGVGNDQIFVNSQMMFWARFPNTTTLDVSRPVWDTSSTVTSSFVSGQWEVSLTDADLPGDASEWVGGYVRMSSGSGWVQDTGQIQASSAGNTLDFNLAGLRVGATYQPVDNDRYYITGAFKALDSAGEWYRDPNTDTLYLWQPGGGDPDNAVVEYKARELAFNLSGKDYIVLDGVDVFGASIRTSESSEYITIQNMDAKYVSHFELIGSDAWQRGKEDTGIILKGKGNTLKDSTIAYSAGNGVLVVGEGNSVVNNVIRDVGYSATDTAAVQALKTASMPINRNLKIAFNTMYNSGRSLIVHGYVESSSIINNELYNAMLQTSDGGALSTYGVDPVNDSKGTVIAYNRIYDIYAFGDPANSKLAVGIYPDNGSSNYVIHNNVVWNAGKALQINTYSNPQGILVYNNTLIGRDLAIDAWGPDPGTRNMAGTVIRNNILVGGVSIYNTGSPIFAASNFSVGTVGAVGFVDAANGDLRLTSGSSARDYGEIVDPYTAGFNGTAPDAGATEFGDLQFLAGTGQDDSLDFRAYPISDTGSTLIKAIWYDTLGSGVSYKDVDAENLFGAASDRPAEGVDAGFQSVGWTRFGEWLEYTIDVQSAGTYDWQLTASELGVYDSVSVQVSDGQNWNTLGRVHGDGTPQLKAYSLEGTFLNAGLQTVRLVINGDGGFAIESFALERVGALGAATSAAAGPGSTIPVETTSSVETTSNIATVQNLTPVGEDFSANHFLNTIASVVNMQAAVDDLRVGQPDNGSQAELRILGRARYNNPLVERLLEADRDFDFYPEIEEIDLLAIELHKSDRLGHRDLIDLTEGLSGFESDLFSKLQEEHGEAIER